MTDQTALVRRRAIEIDMAWPATPVWSPLPGMTGYKDPFAPTEQRDSDFDSDGAVGYTRTAGEWGRELKISCKEDDTTYVMNTVHRYIKDRALTRHGKNTVVHFRDYDRRGGTDNYEGYALVTWASEGGDDEQLDIVTLTFKPWSGNPALQQIASPVDATPLPVISSLTPATGAAAGGDIVVIRGAYFTDATDVDFGVAAADFEVVSDTVIVAVTPAVAASTVRVKVTTPNGETADTAADNFTYA